MMVFLVMTTIASLLMTGLIWFVQVVHYPLMANVGDAGWQRYHHQHTRQTTWVVMPVMVIELITMLAAIWFTQSDSALMNRLFLWLAAALLGIVWLSTFLLQVPAHRRLSERFDDLAHRHLVASNWLRTVAWTARSALLCAVLVSHRPL